MEFTDARSHHALPGLQPLGNDNPLSGNLSDRDFAIFQLQRITFAFDHPHVRLVARAVIRIEHRFHRHNQRIAPRARRKIRQIDRHGAANAADSREIIRARHG
ncbi:hypothetical protein D3C81_2026090 [compost metagenome]